MLASDKAIYTVKETWDGDFSVQSTHNGFQFSEVAIYETKAKAESVALFLNAIEDGEYSDTICQEASQATAKMLRQVGRSL